MENTAISGLLAGFKDYLLVERGFSFQTAKKYVDNITYFIRHIADIPVVGLQLTHVLALKAHLRDTGTKEARVASVICALKALLRYAGDILNLNVLDPSKLKAPRCPRRDVTYLTNEELDLFLRTIPLRTLNGKSRLAGYCFRALVESLAATGMRISEALSLDRDSIDFKQRQALVAGKGNKKRTVFFTDRAIQWIVRYLDLRPDSHPALFVTVGGQRLKTGMAQFKFKKHARFAGIQKRVTPHIIRHTTATNLLKNGCSVGYIKEILGHERIETTCRFYLGILTKRDTEKAHRAFLNFALDEPVQASDSAFGAGEGLPWKPLSLDDTLHRDGD